MHHFGATKLQLGAIAVAQSKAAAQKSAPVYKTPLTIEG